MRSPLRHPEHIFLDGSYKVSVDCTDAQCPMLLDHHLVRLAFAAVAQGRAAVAAFVEPFKSSVKL